MNLGPPPSELRRERNVRLVLRRTDGTDAFGGSIGRYRLVRSKVGNQNTRESRCTEEQCSECWLEPDWHPAAFAHILRSISRILSQTLSSERS
jgi:hypothetical protein